MSNTKQFRRSIHNRVVGGVCSGLADFLGIDIFVVRLLFVLLVIFWGSGVGIYIILWIAMPKEFIDYQSKINQEVNVNADTTPYANSKMSKGNTELVFGIVFIAIGGLLLLRLFLKINFFEFWPVILIAIGVLIVATSFKSKK